MARPIKETPILRGSDADRFLSNMKEVGHAPESEIEKAEKAYEAFKSISTFKM